MICVNSVNYILKPLLNVNAFSGADSKSLFYIIVSAAEDKELKKFRFRIIGDESLSLSSTLTKKPSLIKIFSFQLRLDLRRRFYPFLALLS